MLEDSALDAQLAIEMLESTEFAHECTWAQDRETFEANVSLGAVDLILADYALPDFDGITALEIARERCPGVPFIFVSGVMGEDIAVQAMHKGATDFVLKSRLDRLGPAVRRALEEKRERERRRKAEAELRATEQRYRALVDNAREYAMVMTDADSQLTLWNPGAERMFGYAEAEAISKRLDDLLADVEGGGDTIDRAVQEAAATGEGHADLWLRRKDGSRLWATGITTRVPGHGFITVLRDATDRQLQEQERAARAAELEELNTALARSNRDLEQFAYAASHDLQQPLRTVKSFVQLLALRYRDKLDTNGREFVGYIEDGVDRMQELILDLLEYSRVLYQAKEAERDADMNELFDLAIDSLDAAIRETNAVVTHGELPVVYCHPKLMVLLLQNLLSNALKYKSDCAPEIHFAAERRAKDWLFSVRDNGIGFESQYAGQIFELFRRLHSDAEYPGTGVGLALCRKMVEQEGGRIWAESQPGAGSTFFFTLPLSR